MPHGEEEHHARDKPIMHPRHALAAKFFFFFHVSCALLSPLPPGARAGEGFP